MHTATRRFVTDAECKQGKCANNTTGCIGHCMLNESLALHTVTFSHDDKYVANLQAELSATKEKLNEALESNKAVWKELESVDYAGSMDEAVRYLKRENAELRKQLETIAHAMHYPAHWDDVAYPTLVSAITEVFDCSVCDDPVAHGLVVDDSMPIAKPKELGVNMKIPELKDGEIYAGAIINPDGTGNHIILLDGDNDDASWQAQIDWAKSIGGDLPDRVEQAMLYKHLKDRFKADWYWSNTPHLDTRFAWIQHFTDGYQSYYGTSRQFRARAVRRITIE